MFKQVSGVDEALSRTLPCSQCGGQVAFAAGATALTCGHCGATESIPTSVEHIEEIDYQATLQELEDRADTVTARAVSCETCGAEIELEADVASTVCPFCDSAIVESGHTTRAIAPNGVLPFKVDDSSARMSFRNWLKGLWFAPSGLAQQCSSTERLRGMYVPYWIFGCLASTFYSGRRGIIIRSGDKIETKWRSVVGYLKQVLTYIGVPATQSIPEDHMRGLEPWDWANLVDFNKDYLRGYETEHYHVDLTQGFGRAQPLIDLRVHRGILGDIGGDRQEVRTSKTKLEQIAFRHVLVPVWISAYRYRDQVYRFMINGRTGRVHGERPWDRMKIAAAVGAALAVTIVVGFAIMWLVHINA
jgi:predicted RNA-binding Zn-ribbon protein involved in translation (DUF1610 family)/ribosomal protein S27AE